MEADRKTKQQKSKQEKKAKILAKKQLIEKLNELNHEIKELNDKKSCLITEQNEILDKYNGFPKAEIAPLNENERQIKEIKEKLEILNLQKLDIENQLQAESSKPSTSQQLTHEQLETSQPSTSQQMQEQETTPLLQPEEPRPNSANSEPTETNSQNSSCSPCCTIS